MNLDDDTPQIEDLTLDTPEVDEPQPDAPAAEVEQPEDEPIGFTFEGEEGAEEPQPDDSPVIRTLREKTREQARRIKELEAKTKPAEESAGPEPTLESCGYDEDAFKQAFKDWTAKQGEAERRAREAEEAQRKRQEEWANRVATFETKAKEVVPNFTTVAQTVADHFGDDEAGNYAKAILIYADDPRLIAALNASPTKLAELVAMKNDPTALAIAVGELKGKIKPMARRQPPAPESITKGSAPVAASVDKELERLEKEADRSGDRSAVIAYRRKLRQNAA